MHAHFYRKGIIVRMNVVKCTGAEHKGLMETLAAASGGSGDVGFCREYTLKTERVLYHIRIRKELLLPIGEEVEFRLSQKELIVKQDDNPEEAKFSVISMKLIGEADEEDQRAVRLFAKHCVDEQGMAGMCSER